MFICCFVVCLSIILKYLNLNESSYIPLVRKKCAAEKERTNVLNYYFIDTKTFLYDKIVKARNLIACAHKLLSYVCTVMSLMQNGPKRNTKRKVVVNSYLRI